MLKFDIEHLLKLKGGKTHTSFLRQNGFSRTSSFHLTSNKVKRLNVSDIRKLCKLFNCTPSDLFSISQSDADALPTNSAIRKLVRTPVLSMAEVLSDLSVEQANELMDKIRELKKQT